jgi:hypothetical protein
VLTNATTAACKCTEPKMYMTNINGSVKKTTEMERCMGK